ncbi:MAG: Tex family protein [Crocinitomicaceae bacterium]|jgi:uncharacterized protein
MNKIQFIEQQTSLVTKAIENTVALLEEGATIPFIARYRKERTGGLDELQIASIRDNDKKFEEIIQRQKTIIKAIEEQGKLTDELKSKIENAFDLIQLEDIYLPYKKKRLTRGEKARKLGLEPLAKMILAQKGGTPERLAESIVKGDVQDEDMALQGANDIIAEWVNENGALRNKIRRLFQRKAVVTAKVVKGKNEEGAKYADYFDFNESLFKIPSHRLLAIIRGEKEGVISFKVQPDKEEAISMVHEFFVRGENSATDFIKSACNDGYNRLLMPSIENEIINEAKLKADITAIQVFSKNLKQLLLAPPLGSKRILAIDPGFRTGCKVVCIDEKGDLLTNVTIFPHAPQNERDKASAKIAQLVQAYKIEAIAIGDGTAGRETEFLIKKTRFDRDIEVFVVREDGASIYSASPIARKEFPDYDVTVRGAVSIGRRLMDPLSELVKIDPKSIGVGQYQHEVDQKLLKESLDDVVVSAVNNVGVDVNVASSYLLQYVSGLSASLAENIVKHRQEIGAFQSRTELKNVKGLGPKAFEQAAGFLRIREGENPLDNSSVHPESYELISKMAKKLKLSVSELLNNNEAIQGLKQTDFSEVDSFTFNDIIEELKKPGRDPRKKAKVMEFSKDIRSIEDLKVGFKLTGIVTNVTAFGAFVNIGIKENGLIHKSNLSDSYVEDPTQYIALHEHVNVEVMEVDVARKRIGLRKI